jgi:hypothetical protein
MERKLKEKGEEVMWKKKRQRKEKE